MCSAGAVGETEPVTEVLIVTGLAAGGVGRHVEQLTRGLTARGHRVRVACPSVVAARFALAGAGAELIEAEIGSRPAPHRDHRVVSTLRAAMAGTDVVHAHGLRAGALACTARTRWPAGAASLPPPLVVTHHNVTPEGRVAGVLFRGLERVVARGADLVLSVSPDLARRADALGATVGELAVVPATPQAQTRDAAAVRAELGVPAGGLLLVTVGRLAPQKGFDRLLDAVSLLEAARRAQDRVSVALPDFVLAVCGNGPQCAALQRRIEREQLPVRLLGHRDDVPDLLAAADVAVSSARWEGQPVWLQEALAAGAPIVATDVGGTDTVLAGAGALVPDTDPDCVSGALAQQLSAVLGDEGLRARLARRSRERATELPSVQDAVDAALAAYGRAAGGAGRVGT